MKDEEMADKHAEEYVMREDIITENDRVPFDNGYGLQGVIMTEEQIEQKAEEYANNLLKDVTCNIGHPRARQINSIDIEDAWLYGYKEGFKDCEKEHEWHYVKEGDLPKQEGNTCFSIDVLANNKKWVYYHFGYGKWFCGSEEVKVVAWKEIVFPKEIE